MTLHRLKTTAVDNVPDLLLVAGAVSVSYGVALIYVPAGLIVGGLFALVAGVFMSRGGK